MMKNIFYILNIIICFLSCNSHTNSNKKNLKDSKINKIDSLAIRYLELNRFSGTILIAKEDSILYNNNFGLANYKENKPFSNITAFKIGEISELITENIILEMVNQEKIKLSDKVSKHIPEIKISLTIDDLLNKSNSLPNIQTIHKQYPEVDYSTISYTNLSNEFSETSIKSELHYNILGLLIERINGLSFQKNIKNYSNRLGLKNTYLKKNDSSTALGYLYNNYRGKGDELHQAPHYDLNIAYSSYGIKSSTYDLLKIINLEDEIDINGYIKNDGFSYSIYNNPKTKTSIIILSNRRHPVCKEISNSILSILKGFKYRLPLSRKPFNINTELLKDYTGTYSLNENMNFNVINNNDSLFVVMGPNKIHLIPQSSNQFYMQQTDASMRFSRDSNNLVNEVTLLNGFLNGDKAKRLE